MAQIKRKVSDAEPITGKKLVAFLISAPPTPEGYPSEINYSLELKEPDETTNATQPNQNEFTKEVFKEKVYSFKVNNRKISSVTRLYLPDNTADVNAIKLNDYFMTKVINTLPGVGNSDPSADFYEGQLREMILIKQANGELPV